MTRQFKTPDYEATLNLTITLRDALPLNHLARFVVDVIAQLDLSRIYAGYAPVGGVAFAPEILLGLLFYGYATGVFSSRKIEHHTYESIPFRFIASGLHPDHDTIANFRKTFLVEIQELFVKSYSWRTKPARSNWATSVWTAARFMPMPPSTTRSVTNAWWNGTPNCAKKSTPC